MDAWMDLTQKSLIYKYFCKVALLNTSQNKSITIT